MLGERVGVARGALAAVTAAALLTAGCGGTGEPEVKPLGEGGPTGPESAPAPPGDTTDSPPTTSRSAAESGGGTDAESRALRAEVDELLSRYDAAFADLAADPLSAMDDSAAAVRAWQAEVVIGTRLDRQVRVSLRTDAELNRVLYQPDAAGVVMVTHARHPSRDLDGSVTFDVCQFTPWHEVDADTGEVLDDRPFQRTGSATAVRNADGRLLLEHLSDDRQVELPSGSGDPCA